MRMGSARSTKRSMKNKPPTGTKEWASHNYNWGLGCSHNCAYCYARVMALQYGRIKSREEWATECLLEEKVVDRYPHHRDGGRIMVPTTHDITPGPYLFAAIRIIHAMLEAGNKVLIVTKPHRECVEAMCKMFRRYKDQVLFRFTIGSDENRVLKFWEPGAPSYEERIASLIYADQQGYRTSVSIEPLLGGGFLADILVGELSPFVTDTIWIGKMNQIKRRVDCSDRFVLSMARGIEYSQSDEGIKELYESLKDNPKVRWKDSIRKVVSSAI